MISITPIANWFPLIITREFDCLINYLDWNENEKWNEPAEEELGFLKDSVVFEVMFLFHDAEKHVCNNENGAV